jgi:isopropylmalate/homocitrate/citramalate synthase
MRLLFGPSALGGKSIELKAEEMGIQLNEDKVKAIVAEIRTRLDSVDSLDEDKVEHIIRDISG